MLALRGIAVPTVDAFATPLGEIPLDRDALAAIADLPFVVQTDAPHAPEHALEVELPFLQLLLGLFAWCRCWSVMPMRTTWRGAAAAVGRRGDADRRELRPLPLP